MSIRMDTVRRALPSFWTCLTMFAAMLVPPLLGAQEAGARRPVGEANLVIPDLNSVQFLGMPGRTLLMTGLVVCALGLIFGLVIYAQLKRLAVHEAIREISELIYETCKTYLS